jgi:DNA-binding MarR family transcriptional regulator
MEIPWAIKVDRSALEQRLHELVVAGMIKIAMHQNAKSRLNVSLTPYGRDVVNRFARTERD